MTKHARFLNIEQPRDDRPPESETANRARIAAVLRTAPLLGTADEPLLEVDPDARAGDGTAHDPGGQQELAPADDAPGAEPPDLPIDVEGIQGQPFVRCARCGADSSIHAVTCDNCAADLDTAEQRAFNEKLWDAARQRSERERAALAAMSEARAEQRRATARMLPEPGTLPPPELTEPLHGEDGPFFLEVLNALTKPKWRWAAGGLAVGLPLFLVALGDALLSKLGWALLLLLVLSMFPRRLGRRLLSWWTGR